MAEDSRPIDAVDTGRDIVEDEQTEQEQTEQEQTEQNPNGYMQLADLIQQVMTELVDIRADLAKVIEVKNTQAIDDGAVIEDDTAAEDPADELPTLAEERDYSID